MQQDFVPIVKYINQILDEFKQYFSDDHFNVPILSGPYLLNKSYCWNLLDDSITENWNKAGSIPGNQKHGIYLLLGRTENTKKPAVYVGKAFPGKMSDRINNCHLQRHTDAKDKNRTTKFTLKRSEEVQENYLLEYIITMAIDKNPWVVLSLEAFLIIRLRRKVGLVNKEFNSDALSSAFGLCSMS